MIATGVDRLRFANAPKYIITHALIHINAHFSFLRRVTAKSQATEEDFAMYWFSEEKDKQGSREVEVKTNGRWI